MDKEYQFEIVQSQSIFVLVSAGSESQALAKIGEGQGELLAELPAEVINIKARTQDDE